MNYKDPNINLTKLKEILGYRDIRSVLEWCEKNGVYVLRQGNKKVVNSAEFILSYYKPFINHLKIKHHNWKEYFLNYLDINLRKLITDSSPIQEIMIQNVEPMKIQSKNRTNGNNRNSSFLNMLKNL